jgi:hypothetical protein
MRLPIRALPLLTLFGLAACGGADAATTSAKGPPPAPGSFAAMSKEQKLAHMKTVVQPAMSKIFQAFDAKRYEGFGCASCHGPTKDQDPHKALVKLQLSGDGFQRLAAEKPLITKLMTEKVTPAMAAAMSEKPFDPATKQGFGCGGCHTVE